MPLPLVLGIGAGIAAAGGLSSGINGGFKMKQASDTLKKPRKRGTRQLQSLKKRTSRLLK